MYPPQKWREDRPSAQPLDHHPCPFVLTNHFGIWFIGLLAVHLISFCANKILQCFTSLHRNTFNDILFTDFTPFTPTGSVSFSGSGCIRCSHTLIPGPIPDRSNVQGYNLWLKIASNQGILTLSPRNHNHLGPLPNH
jgi:hypothetical protein